MSRTMRQRYCDGMSDRGDRVGKKKKKKKKASRTNDTAAHPVPRRTIFFFSFDGDVSACANHEGCGDVRSMYNARMSATNLGKVLNGRFWLIVGCLLPLTP